MSARLSCPHQSFWIHRSIVRSSDWHISKFSPMPLNRSSLPWSIEYLFWLSFHRINAFMELTRKLPQVLETFLDLCKAADHALSFWVRLQVLVFLDDVSSKNTLGPWNGKPQVESHIWGAKGAASAFKHYLLILSLVSDFKWHPRCPLLSRAPELDAFESFSRLRCCLKCGTTCLVFWDFGCDLRVPCPWDGRECRQMDNMHIWSSFHSKWTQKIFQSVHDSFQFQNMFCDT